MTKAIEGKGIGRMGSTPKSLILSGVADAILIKSYLDSQEDKKKEEDSWKTQGTVVEIKFDCDRGLL